MTDWDDVAQVLLGSWPSQVSSWGREGIAAFLTELKGRRLTPDDAVRALRCSDAKFPPSAGELAAAARRDPSLPTFDEMLLLLGQAFRFGSRPTLEMYDSEGAMLRAQDDRTLGWLRENSAPVVAAFVERQGVMRLGMMRLGDPDWGEKRRRDLEAVWDEFVETWDERKVAAIAAGSTGDGLRRLDPLAALKELQP